MGKTAEANREDHSVPAVTETEDFLELMSQSEDSAEAATTTRPSSETRESSKAGLYKKRSSRETSKGGLEDLEQTATRDANWITARKLRREDKQLSQSAEPATTTRPSCETRPALNNKRTSRETSKGCLEDLEQTATRDASWITARKLRQEDKQLSLSQSVTRVSLRSQSQKLQCEDKLLSLAPPLDSSSEQGLQCTPGQPMGDVDVPLPQLLRHPGSAPRFPGVVHVEGSDYFPGMDGVDPACGRGNMARSVPSPMGDDNETQNDESLRDESVLVHAHVVTPELDKIFARAKPDPWWKRHQWKLTLAVALLLVAIVLSVVLTSLDFGRLQAPPATMAPTSLYEGLEDQTVGLIVSKVPSSSEPLADTSTTEYRALQWVTQRRIDDELTDAMVLQQYSLAALYFSMNGESNGTWLQSESWLSATSPCFWYGVICANNSQSGLEEDAVIVGLNLTSNGLKGSIGPEISILSEHLRKLDLSDNTLGGTLPDEMSSMTLLTHLSLAQNNFEGSIPASIGSLPNLRRLDLRMNKLGATIPPELGSLSLLEEIRVAKNEIIGGIPSTIGLLLNLVHIDVSENKLSFALPSELGQLVNLRTMVARRNSLLGSLPSEIGLMRNLATLDVSENFISSFPFELKSLLNIRVFDLSHNIITNKLLSDIESFDKLTTLRLRGNFLQGQIPLWIEMSESLVHLDLSSNYFTGSLATRIWSLPELQYLKVSHTNLNGAFHWGSESLQVLDLSWSGFSSMLDGKLGRSTNLTTLNLAGRTLVSTIPTEIGCLTKLIDIDMSFNELAGSIPSQLQSLTKLQSFDVRRSNLDAIKIPLQAFPHADLKVLRLTGNSFTGSLPSQIGLFSSLESLDLSYMSLSGSIPSEVGLLSRLTVFGASHNHLTGKIPPELGSSNLVSLELDDNTLSGTLPVELGQLSRLAVLFINENQLSGRIPTTIGALTSLKNFRAYLNSLTGTIPSEIGFLQELHSLGLGSNSLSGSLPTEVGLLTLMRELVVPETFMSGVLPSEIGLLTDMYSLWVYDNPNLSGSIPSEIGMLSDLWVLAMQGCSLTGELPSEIGQMSSLEELHGDNNLLTGELPSELGQMPLLHRIDLSGNALSGTVPPELQTLAEHMFFVSTVRGWGYLNISDTDITGSISDAFCIRNQTDADSDFGNVSLVAVDCDNIMCTCCRCVAPMSPGIPGASPSSNAPSHSHEPSLSPSLTFQPSNSFVPTDYRVCDDFASIASVGSLLSISDLDEASEVVELPFFFRWRGGAVYSAITVTTNGVVFPGEIIWRNTLGTPPHGCCGPEPIIESGMYSIPRIAVAQADLGPDGAIYTAQLEDAFVISWEGVALYDDFLQDKLDFQVLLYENGSVEMRWGRGAPIIGGFAAGLEDDLANSTVPATGSPFDDLYGLANEFPENQCRRFAVFEGSYLEVFSWNY